MKHLCKSDSISARSREDSISNFTTIARPHRMSLSSRVILLLSLATAGLAFQLPSPPRRLTQRSSAPAMGPFDFLAFGQAAASHILLSDSGRANFIKGQIEAGKISFAAAAKEYSTCPSSAQGGDLGAFKRDAMVAQFSDYCYDPDTKVNELGIVRTQFGTHIVKLTKKP